jgi:hypothetical protein
MATRTTPAPIPEPVATPVATPAADPAWQPSPGMKFSTVKVERSCFVAVEHPIEWDGAKVQAAVANRRPEVIGRASWWNGDGQTAITEIHVGLYEPDDANTEPHTLTPDDLTAPPPPVIVEAPSPE